MKKILLIISGMISTLTLHAQIPVTDVALNASVGSLSGTVNAQLSTLNTQAGVQNSTLSTISGSTGKSAASLAQVVQRQNEIRLGLKNPSAIMKFDIVLSLIKMIADIKCANANLPQLLKRTNAMSYCGFSLKYNSVSVQLGSAAQFLQLAISMTESTSGERAQNLRAAFSFFQDATFSYLSMTRMLQKQLDDNYKVNNRRKDYSTVLRLTY